MKTLKKTIVLFAFILPFALFGQEAELPEEGGLPSPAEGKALIIFIRPSLEAPILKFKYFCNDTYLGKIGVGDYLAYECDPGKYLFWANSESIRVVKASIQANRVYIFNTFVKTGMVQPVLTLIPFEPDKKQADNVRERLISRVVKRNEVRFDPAAPEQPSKRLQRTADEVFATFGVEPTETDNKRWSDVTRMEADQYVQ